MHNPSYRNKIHNGSKTKFDVPMQRRNYSISTYTFLTTLSEKHEKCYYFIVLMYCAF
jgi:hypothetical protein